MMSKSDVLRIIALRSEADCEVKLVKYKGDVLERFQSMGCKNVPKKVLSFYKLTNGLKLMLDFADILSLDEIDEMIHNDDSLYVNFLKEKDLLSLRYKYIPLAKFRDCFLAFPIDFTDEKIYQLGKLHYSGKGYDYFSDFDGVVRVLKKDIDEWNKDNTTLEQKIRTIDKLAKKLKVESGIIPPVADVEGEFKKMGINTVPSIVLDFYKMTNGIIFESNSYGYVEKVLSLDEIKEQIENPNSDYAKIMNKGGFDKDLYFPFFMIGDLSCDTFLKNSDDDTCHSFHCDKKEYHRGNFNGWLYDKKKSQYIAIEVYSEEDRREARLNSISSKVKELVKLRNKNGYVAKISKSDKNVMDLFKENGIACVPSKILDFYKVTNGVDLSGRVFSIEEIGKLIGDKESQYYSTFHSLGLDKKAEEFYPFMESGFGGYYMFSRNEEDEKIYLLDIDGENDVVILYDDLGKFLDSLIQLEVDD